MEKKLIWKFNIIDLLIIAIVALSLIALIYKLTWGSGEEKGSFEFTYVCSEAPAELLYSVKRGDICIDGDSGSSLGKISDVRAEILPDSPDKGKAVFKASAKGAKTEHGITINDNIYLKGKTLNLIIGDSVFEVYISDMK